VPPKPPLSPTLPSGLADPASSPLANEELVSLPLGPHAQLHPLDVCGAPP